MSAFRAADVAVMAIAFAIAMAASAERMSIDFQDFLAVRIKFSNILLFVGFSVIWHLIFISQGLYRSRRIGLIKVEWWDVTKAVVLGTLLLSAVTLFFKISAINRTFLATFFAVVLSGYSDNAEQPSYCSRRCETERTQSPQRSDCRLRASRDFDWAGVEK